MNKWEHPSAVKTIKMGLFHDLSTFLNWHNACLVHPQINVRVMKLIDTQHTDLLKKALDAYALRQKAIASNVANIDTPGYKRLEVNFEDALQKAQKLQTVQTDFDDVQLKLQETDEKPLLEDEMMTLADTQIRAQLVTRTLRHNFQLLKAGIIGRNA
jgi:flagellar basal-body rod protein FlgB